MPTSENPSREAVLRRIRAALKTPAKVQDSPGHVHAGPGDIFPPIGDPLERFRMECVGNKTELLVTSNFEASVAATNSILLELGAAEIFMQDAPELRRAASQFGSSKEIQWSSASGPRESASVSITLAELLVAQTGSVLISSGCGGRGASVAAPVHIVLASLNQLVPDLETAMAQAVPTVEKNSYACLITGSSRTADIEKILVMGAHGPKRLIVILSQA
ncbi:MAG: lactate utilization protein [Candidatus Acidiferrales bacterium]